MDRKKCSEPQWYEPFTSLSKFDKLFILFKGNFCKYFCIDIDTKAWACSILGNILIWTIQMYMLISLNLKLSFQKLQSNGLRMFAPQLSEKLSILGSSSRLRFAMEKSRFRRTCLSKWIVICTKSFSHLQLSAVSTYTSKSIYIS